MKNFDAEIKQYFDLLEKWNKTFNLTAITSREEMLTHHLQDSLSVLPYITGKRLLDVGTGAGFPGMILAIARPDLEVTLLDSAGKKTRFLQQVRAALKLTHVTVVQSRVENYQPEILFDQVISRAFSSISDFLEGTEHLCGEGGEFLAMKGKYPEDEMKAIPSRFIVSGLHRLEVPGLCAERHLVTILKKE